MQRPDAEVRNRSHAVFATGMTDQQRLAALAPLPGFATKDAMATAVLACNDPNDYGVMDRRALDGLKRVCRPIRRGRGRTLRYLDRIRELRDLVSDTKPNVTARDIDLALWTIGGE